MSKFTTETATLKAIVIDTNILKINGRIFNPSTGFQDTNGDNSTNNSGNSNTSTGGSTTVQQEVSTDSITKFAQFSFAELKNGLNYEEFKATIDVDAGNITLFVRNKKDKSSFNDFILSKVLINGKEILCSSQKNSDNSWLINLWDSGDSLFELYGGINDNTTFTVFFTLIKKTSDVVFTEPTTEGDSPEPENPEEPTE